MLAMASVGAASAETNIPIKPVRLIEPFGAGGGPDLLARALSPKLSELWGEPVMVENHPGAGSTVAPALVAKSPPDGYTVLVSTSAQAYSAAIRTDLPYHCCQVQEISTWKFHCVAFLETLALFRLDIGWSAPREIRDRVCPTSRQ
jgi:tripartite-type tricarboxylate transporter receptor subunit TctC